MKKKLPSIRRIKEKTDLAFLRKFGCDELLDYETFFKRTTKQVLVNKVLNEKRCLR